jgi:hypothetical protein
MSDFDNIQEDRYSDQVEREEALRDLVIDMHTDNWLTAVTQSVEKSYGTFEDVTDYDSKLDNRGFQKRKAKSTDVFIEELHNKDFMERAAQILILLYKIKNTNLIVCKLFDDMAASYAEYQYEFNIKD